MNDETVSGRPILIAFVLGVALLLGVLWGAIRVIDNDREQAASQPATWPTSQPASKPAPRPR